MTPKTPLLRVLKDILAKDSRIAPKIPIAFFIGLEKSHKICVEFEEMQK